MIRVTVHRSSPGSHLDAESLASAFGGFVFVPTWWPADAAPCEFVLDQLPTGIRYRVGSVRDDGRPILCIGAPEDPTARLQDADWHELPELSEWRAIVSSNELGTFHAVAHRDGLTLHLIGYTSEPEVVTAIKSLRKAEPST